MYYDEESKSVTLRLCHQSKQGKWFVCLFLFFESHKSAEKEEQAIDYNHDINSYVSWYKE